MKAREHGVAFWVSAALGWIVIAIGVRGIFEKTIDTRPGQLARFVVGGALLHDLVVAPLAIGVGVVLAKVVRGRARPVVQAALLVTAVVILFAYPLVRAYGLATNNPTSLPHNYTANLALVLALVWAVAGTAIALRYRRPGNDAAANASTTPN